MGTLVFGVRCMGNLILEGGMTLRARYDGVAVRGLLGQEGVELLPPYAADSFALQLTKGDRRAVDPRRVYILERRGYIGRERAEDFMLNGAIATHLALLRRNAFMRYVACSPETMLACGHVEKPRQRHRCKRPSGSRSRLATQSQ